jgi:L-cystine uptake protein TcyP (sodium:dicarboxylate symporter family)
MVHNNIKEERFSLKSSTNNRIQNELRPSLKDTIRTNIKENFLLASTIAAVTLGISLGFILRYFYEFNENENKYFGFIGQIFLRMLKFLILPLIAFRLINFKV